MSQQREIFEALKETHGHVIGGSGSGKSKFLEWLMRWRTANGGAFGLIDWHGTLYNDLLNYYATIPPPRKIYLIDPARGDLINGFNPFNGYSGDLSTAVSRRRGDGKAVGAREHRDRRRPSAPSWRGPGSRSRRSRW